MSNTICVEGETGDAARDSSSGPLGESGKIRVNDRIGYEAVGISELAEVAHQLGCAIVSDEMCGTVCVGWRR